MMPELGTLPPAITALIGGTGSDARGPSGHPTWGPGPDRRSGGCRWRRSVSS